MAISYCYFQNGIVPVKWSRSGVGAGVGFDISESESESELESLEIRRLRIPGQNATGCMMPYHPGYSHRNRNAL